MKNQTRRLIIVRGDQVKMIASGRPMRIRQGDTIYQRDLDCVLEQHPNLSANGMKCSYHLEGRYANSFEEWRQELRGSLVAVRKSVRWISATFEPPSARGRYMNAYSLKHSMEANPLRGKSTYVTNGVFTMALFLLGYRPRFRPDSPNVSFLLKEREI